MATGLHKSGDTMGIWTDATDERAFIGEVSEALASDIDSGLHEYDWEFQLRFWLPQIVEICCSYRGYPSAANRTVLLSAGDLFSPLEIAVYTKGTLFESLVPKEEAQSCGT